MKITPIIAHLRAQCPTFAGRVGGGIEFDAARENAQMAMPAAYVIYTGDSPAENALQNETSQEIKDEFDVVVFLATKDERGQSLVDELHDIRAELLRALVGLEPASGYEGIEYEDSLLLNLDRNRALYKYGFSATWTLGGGEEPETWQEVELAGLAKFEGYNLHVDAIDPMADKNLKYPGPDGRIEFQLKDDLP
jgi:hypothetical protein